MTLSSIAALQQALEALQVGRDCAAELLAERQHAYAGYPHKWAIEQEAVSQIDAALSSLRAVVKDTGEGEVRMLTREEVHAALPAPTNDRREFKGATCVQMTWSHFNTWAAALQARFCEVNGLRLPSPPN